MAHLCKNKVNRQLACMILLALAALMLPSKGQAQLYFLSIEAKPARLLPQLSDQYIGAGLELEWLFWRQFSIAVGGHKLSMEADESQLAARNIRDLHLEPRSGQAQLLSAGMRYYARQRAGSFYIGVMHHNYKESRKITDDQQELNFKLTANEQALELGYRRYWPSMGLTTRIGAAAIAHGPRRYQFDSGNPAVAHAIQGEYAVLVSERAASDRQDVSVLLDVGIGLAF